MSAPTSPSIDLAIHPIEGPSLEGRADCTLLHFLRAEAFGNPVDALQLAAWRSGCRAAGLDDAPDAPAVVTGIDLAVATTECLLAHIHDRPTQGVRPARGSPGAFLISPATEGIARSTAQVAVGFVTDLLAGGDGWRPERLVQDVGRLRQLVSELPDRADPVTPLMVEAARALGLPWRPSRLQPGTILFGEGRRQVRFDRSAPLNAPTLGAALTPSKLATKRFLAGLGIPVLPCRVVVDRAEAGRAAAELGFPVAVKPIDGTLFQGVALDVRTAEEAEAAYDRAARHGSAVMIEPYLDTPDFRATVIGGAVAIVMQRNRPYVVGDGERTIAALIAAHNADLRQGRAGFPGGYVLEIDDEVRWTLARAGLSLDTVPDAGHRVMVRTAPVRSLGGYPTNETARAHPEMLRLFERIAHVLAMPVVAIDFRAEALDRPWQDQRIAVLEANARPSIGDIEGDRLARRILEHHFPDPAAARLPTMLVVDPDADANFPAVRAALGTIRSLGLAGPSGVVLDGLPASGAPASTGAAHGRIAEDATIGLALHWTTGRRIARRGLGIGRIDHAFLPATSPDPIAALVRDHADRVDRFADGAPLADRLATVAATAGRLLLR